jgi:hypothetical protein
MIIQPGKNEEFRGLCSHDHPVTDNLFGDDLEKTVESIVKRNKVGYRISGGLLVVIFLSYFVYLEVCQ